MILKTSFDRDARTLASMGMNYLRGHVTHSVYRGNLSYLVLGFCYFCWFVIGYIYGIYRTPHDYAIEYIVHPENFCVYGAYIVLLILSLLIFFLWYFSKRIWGNLTAFLVLVLYYILTIRLFPELDPYCILGFLPILFFMVGVYKGTFHIVDLKKVELPNPDERKRKSDIYLTFIFFALAAATHYSMGMYITVFFVLFVYLNRRVYKVKFFIYLILIFLLFFLIPNFNIFMYYENLYNQLGIFFVDNYIKPENTKIVRGHFLFIEYFNFFVRNLGLYTCIYLLILLIISFFIKKNRIVKLFLFMGVFGFIFLGTATEFGQYWFNIFLVVPFIIPVCLSLKKLLINKNKIVKYFTLLVTVILLLIQLIWIKNYILNYRQTLPESNSYKMKKWIEKNIKPGTKILDSHYDSSLKLDDVKENAPFGQGRYPRLISYMKRNNLNFKDKRYQKLIKFLKEKPKYDVEFLEVRMSDFMNSSKKAETISFYRKMGFEYIVLHFSRYEKDIQGSRGILKDYRDLLRSLEKECKLVKKFGTYKLFEL